MAGSLLFMQVGDLYIGLLGYMSWAETPTRKSWHSGLYMTHSKLINWIKSKTSEICQFNHIIKLPLINAIAKINILFIQLFLSS